MKRITILSLLMLALQLGCQKKPARAEKTMNTSVVLKVSVLQSGSILADGTETKLESLDSRMAEVKAQDGVVYYYREAGNSEPPPVWKNVMELVAKHRLPISMSSKADFSDYIDEQGNSNPRSN